MPVIPSGQESPFAVQLVYAGYPRRFRESAEFRLILINSPCQAVKVIYGPPESPQFPSLSDRKPHDVSAESLAMIAARSLSRTTPTCGKGAS